MLSLQGGGSGPRLRGCPAMAVARLLLGASGATGGGPGSGLLRTRAPPGRVRKRRPGLPVRCGGPGRGETYGQEGCQERGPQACVAPPPAPVPAHARPRAPAQPGVPPSLAQVPWPPQQDRASLDPQDDHPLPGVFLLTLLMEPQPVPYFQCWGPGTLPRPQSSDIRAPAGALPHWLSWRGVPGDRACLAQPSCAAT